MVIFTVYVNYFCRFMTFLCGQLINSINECAPNNCALLLCFAHAQYCTFRSTRAVVAVSFLSYSTVAEQRTSLEATLTSNHWSR